MGRHCKGVPSRSVSGYSHAESDPLTSTSHHIESQTSSSLQRLKAYGLLLLLASRTWRSHKWHSPLTMRSHLDTDM